MSDMPLRKALKLPSLRGYTRLSGMQLVLLYGRLREYRYAAMTNKERVEWMTRLDTVERHLIKRLT